MKLENRLCRQYEEKVRPCIDLIDSLRALGVEQDLALPAIAVIGDQSSGKSSVLEALSGVALPRGSGIVTRCPLVLKLKKLKSQEKWTGKISYKDIEINLSSPSEVEKEISKSQNLMAGEGVGISHELISLEVSSPHVPDLTLIDLPGITRVPVGNQPPDIEYQIKTLIRKYIQRQETINLVVVPCNVDIATTEALRMAQEVDPEGDRTIEIVHVAFSDVTKKNYEEFFNFLKVCKANIEDIKVKQEEEAEKCIRLQFQMEQIIYCQDHEYQTWLRKIRETELQQEKTKSSSMPSEKKSSQSFLDEIHQHLWAYHQEASKHLSSQIPLIIQFFMLRSFGQKLNNAMLQLLQDRENYNLLLTERSDTRDKRKFLKEQLVRLTKARHELSKFPS
ncbi:MX dynamin like GTPase 1 [Phyllostomus discolor]|uniref:MX dynamin like GTPase 1 n=1 Tax=Phyllostomus discolor TaxID=89673 RepID=A0A834B2N6_9CHIR|nr:MX dynamin like GTPase 1 [Phyllostomus discolor]